jgi:hypothetical protein
VRVPAQRLDRSIRLRIGLDVFYRCISFLSCSISSAKTRVETSPEYGRFLVCWDEGCLFFLVIVADFEVVEYVCSAE